MLRRAVVVGLWALGTAWGGLLPSPAAAQNLPAPPDTLRTSPPDSLRGPQSAPAGGPARLAPAAKSTRLTPGATNFLYVDSLTAALAADQRWAGLDSVGRAALAVGTDYPTLRQRLGYAARQLGRPAAAVGHYARALAANPTDEESRSQLAQLYLTLAEPGAARLALQPFPDSVRGFYRLPAVRGLSQVLGEGGVRLNGSARRSGAGYGRVGFSSQLSTRLTFTQAVTYYGQTVELGGQETPPAIYPIRQGEYAALLTVQVGLPLQVKVGYHGLYNSFGASRYGSHLGYVAGRYRRPQWLVQGGFHVGHVTGRFRTQTDLHLALYPRQGRPTLYAFGRGSLVTSAGRVYPNGLLGAGGRVARPLWLEGFWSPGPVPVLFERDGADVYNLLDSLRRRMGCTAYGQLGPAWRLYLAYTRAYLQETDTSTRYLHHSLTAGLTWTW